MILEEVKERISSGIRCCGTEIVSQYERCYIAANGELSISCSGTGSFLVTIEPLVAPGSCVGTEGHFVPAFQFYDLITGISLPTFFVHIILKAIIINLDTGPLRWKRHLY